MRNKFGGIVGCMLVLLPILTTVAVADPGPQLDLDIKGGRKVNLVLRNIGDETVLGPNIDMEIVGGLIIKPREFSGSLYLALLPTKQETVPISVCGLGHVIITVTVDASNADPVTEKVNGFVFGRFIIVGDWL